MQKFRVDPIITELRAVREAYAARFGYDIKAICRDVRARQEASGREYVSFPARPAAFSQIEPDKDAHRGN